MSAHALPTRRARRLLAAGAMAAALASLELASTPAHATVWLCQPATKHGPCAPGLSSTVYNPALTTVLGVQHPRATPSSAVSSHPCTAR